MARPLLIHYFTGDTFCTSSMARGTEVSSSRKSKRQRRTNPIARDLRTPMFRQRKAGRIRGGGSLSSRTILHHHCVLKELLKHDICDGATKLLRTRQSGNVWQTQCRISRISAEKRYVKKPLRTRDLEQAKEKGRKLYYAMMGTASRWSPTCISAKARNTRTSGLPIHAVQ